MNPETIDAESVAAEAAQADSEYSPMQPEPHAPLGVWTRDVEALCRALDAQQRAHFRSIGAEEGNSGEPKAAAKGKSR